MSLELPDYDLLRDSLQRINSILSAAEAHGLICGTICLDDENAKKVPWLETIIGKLDKHDVVQHEVAMLVTELYQATEHQLTKTTFDFQLLIPDDEEELSLRAEALGKWCQGFILGLGYANTNPASASSEDVRDAIFHISEFAKIDYQDLDISENDEKAFMEVSEYLRMAVLMIHCELAKKTMVASSNQADEEDSPLH